MIPRAIFIVSIVFTAIFIASMLAGCARHQPPGGGLYKIL